MASGSDSDSGTSCLVDTTSQNEEIKANRRRKIVSLSSTTWGLPEPVLRVGNRTIFTHGRPPWYDTDGQAQQPFVIGICGGSASGKTTVARSIIESIDLQWVSLLSMDSYYKVLSPEQKIDAQACQYNFDHPNAFDFELLQNHLSRLREGKTIEVPEYDFKTHSRTSKTKTMYGANVVIIEGILSFYCPTVAKLMDLKVFVDTDADERLARRLRRDITERGRELSEVLTQYTRFVKPSYDQFIAPTMAQADIILPGGGQNKIGLQLIIEHIDKRLKQHIVKSRHTLAKLATTSTNDNLKSANYCDFPVIGPSGDGNGLESMYSSSLTVAYADDHHNQSNHNNVGNSMNIDSSSSILHGFRLPPRVHVLPESVQALGLHTLIRNRNTEQDAFVFYSERLMRPLCEAAMNLLPHVDVDVDTPQGIVYHGRQLVKGTQVCGVSILRAGETLESALCAVCKDVRLGKILIQTNPITCEPELHYIRLPRDIKDCFVILMESTVATGAAAIMAMRILVEHDVPEDKIILISLLMAIQGVYSVAYTYPKAHIVTTAVDPGLNENYHIVPGVGNFGDRYFGTTADKSQTEYNE